MAGSADTTPTSTGDAQFASTVDRIHQVFHGREYSEQVANAIGAQIVVSDLVGRFIRANDAWLSARGFTSVQDVIGKRAHDVLDPALAAASVAADLEVADTGKPSTSIHSDETGATFQTVRLPLVDEGELLGIIRICMPQASSVDSGVQVVAQDDIDQLTGASSLAALHTYLTELLASPEPMSLLLLDLDDFHVVNNSLGRDVGDRLLQKAAKRLITVFGARLFRTGGDKFVILLPTSEISQLDVVTEQILQRWRQPLVVDGTEIYGGVSIGIAPIEHQSSSIEVLQDAEMALRKAKDSGRNRAVVFDPEQRRNADEKLWQQMLVRRAVASKEFSLHWQPIIELGTGSIAGVEALLRWQPAGGEATHPAAEFIPFLEHSGLIIPVGKQVIDDACRQHTQWRSMDNIARPIPISVNVSRRQFSSNSLAADVLVTLQKHAVDPRNLTLEVSDFSPGEDFAKMIEDLETLQIAGVRIAIDEFGAGWSALDSLPDLPVKVTKVARSITDRIVEGQNDPMLDSIQAIAQSLNHVSIVQGVENDMQLDWLRAKGWTHAQGYHISKPLNPHDMTRFLSDAFAGGGQNQRWGNK